MHPWPESKGRHVCVGVVVLLSCYALRWTAATAVAGVNNSGVLLSFSRMCVKLQ